AIRLRERADQIQTTADLEGTGRVVVLVLDEDAEARLLVEQRVAQERRWTKRAIDALAGRVDVVKARCSHWLPARTIGTILSGRSVISASTPSSRSRRASPSVSIVHT